MFKSKKEIPIQNKASETGTDKVSTLYAVCRRLATRLNDLEEKYSTLRRDLNRIDKRVYRDAELPPPEGNHDQVEDGGLGECLKLMR